MQYNTAKQIVKDHSFDLLDDPALALKGLGVSATPDEHGEHHIEAHIHSLSDTGCDSIDEYRDKLAAAIEAKHSGVCDLDIVVKIIEPLRPQKEEDLVPTLDTRRWFSKPRIGLSITNVASPSYNGGYLTSGTLGLFAKQGEKYFLISNNHVIGGQNNAQPGQAITQPGTLDLSALERRLMPDEATAAAEIGIAKLTKFIPITYGADNPNSVDLAWAELTAAQQETDLSLLAYSGHCVGISPGYQAGEGNNVQGDTHVYKVGRTTGYTEGTVAVIHYTATIPYSGGDAIFEDQIVIVPTTQNNGPFSLPGDSGSGIMDSHHRVAALLFAGNKQMTIASPIQAVIQNLDEGMEIVTNGAGEQEDVITSPTASIDLALGEPSGEIPEGAMLALYQGNPQQSGDLLLHSTFELDDLESGSEKTISIPLELALYAKSSNGEATLENPKPGSFYRYDESNGAGQISLYTHTSIDNENCLVNGLSKGAIEVELLRGGEPVCKKTDVVPQQMASFVDTNKIAIAVFAGVEAGDLLGKQEPESNQLILTPQENERYTIEVQYSAERAGKGEPPFILTLRGDSK